MAAYEVDLVIVGVAVLGAVVLPRLLEERPLSFPMLYVRPATGLLSFVGSSAPWPDRAVLSFFGIRGIGSFSTWRSHWATPRSGSWNC